MSTIPKSPCEIGLVHWFPRLNFGRGVNEAVFPTTGWKGADETLVESFARSGKWLEAFAIEATTITPELADEAVAVRQQQLARAEALAGDSLAGKILLAVLTIRYLDSKGKVIRPTLAGITGNRRSQAIDYGFVRRVEIAANGGDRAAALGLSDGFAQKKSESIEQWVRRLCTFEFPYVYRGDVNVSNSDDMLLTQMRENGMKKEGSKAVSESVLLGQVKHLVDHGRTQAEICRSISTIGQKCCQIVQLDAQMPECEIIKRIGLPATDSRAIPFGKLPNTLAAAIAATSPLDSERVSYNSRKNKAETIPDTQQDAAWLETWLAGKVKGSQAARMMDKSDLAALIGRNSANPVVQAALKAVHDNRPSELAKITSMEIGLRALNKLADDPDAYPKVEALLVALAEQEPSVRVVPSLVVPEPQPARKAGKGKQK